MLHYGYCQRKMNFERETVYISLPDDVTFKMQ